MGQWDDHLINQASDFPFAMQCYAGNTDKNGHFPPNCNEAITPAT